MKMWSIKPLATIEPGTYLGPIEDVEHTSGFVTILVKGYWINVCAASKGGVKFASIVPAKEVER